MPSKRDRTGRSGVLGLIVNDPWRKLISIGLATLLWIYLDTQVSSDKAIDVWFYLDAASSNADDVKGAALGLRVDTRKFTLVAVSDAEDPAQRPIDNDGRKIRLNVKGANRLVTELLADPRFVVQVEPNVREGRAVLEFGVADVHPADSRYEGLLRSMDPPHVRVELGLNVKERLLLDRRDVRVEPPPGVTGFLDRLVWDDVKFSAVDGVEVQGPETVVRAYLNRERPLFVWQPAPPQGGYEILKSQLHLDPAAQGVTIVPNVVVMEVPLRAVGREFKLTNVPVRIVGDTAWDRFRLESDHVEEVRIEAFGFLETTLEGFNPEQLREWIATSCTVLAPIPADAPSEGGLIYLPELHILRVRPELWTMPYPPTINYSPKSP